MKLKVKAEIEVEDDCYCSIDCQYMKETMNYCRLFHSGLLHVYVDDGQYNNGYARILSCECCKQITNDGVLNEYK